ncbi:hypothetical protein GGC65_002430 [Sphingopyxis sp. OAS728]|uniref:hypothetical protein n=1 Tax=Sphingopyxis sp. OAS728 TaxID=2663823 RepID=UPI00178961CE|nr:hypothetical protein [Sphingopyxis sp. OAS728]MBE1527974.1 hypothetical protein [Sphingopyxis sp. OAS728]
MLDDRQRVAGYRGQQLIERGKSLRRGGIGEDAAVANGRDIIERVRFCRFEDRLVI